MLLFHAAWLPKTNSTPARLALWGETDQTPASRRRSTATKRLAPHPFGASPEALQAALPLPDLTAKPAMLVARLPSAGGEPQPSRPFLRERAAQGKAILATWRVPALTFTQRDAVALLIHFDQKVAGGAE